MEKDIAKVINSLGNTFEAIVGLPRLQCRRNWRGIGAPPPHFCRYRKKNTKRQSIDICPFNFLDLLPTLNV